MSLQKEMSLKKAKEAIPAVVRMFSGCEDSQTSADVSDVRSFQLPDTSGRAGGALTSALLSVTYADHHDTGKDLTFKETLFAIREKLKEKGFVQIPQLSSSRPTNLDETFTVVPPDFTGRRRAVMIGINYVGQDPGELSGCHNDVYNMREYIKTCHGFTDKDITLLLDDGKHTEPTAANILATFRKLAREAKPGDALFVHFSGHGVNVPDKNGDEADGMDEAMVPVDYKTAGVILDDTLLEILVCPLPKGVVMTCFIDCCHSGTMLDLPYGFLADGKMEEMELDPDYNFHPLIQAMADFAKAGYEGVIKLHQKGVERRRKRRSWMKRQLGWS